jgi:hypothetical protein
MSTMIKETIVMNELDLYEEGELVHQALQVENEE